jgi:anti-sigma regulatory factor (Ser/Thr protein kinase)
MNGRLRSNAPAELLLQLPPSAQWVPHARRQIRRFCSTRVHALADDAELLTSELVTNACNVASGPIVLAASSDLTGVTITVTDDADSDVRPAVACPTGDADSGRGLFLLDQLAGSWGTIRHRHGKSIWFRLP